MVTKPMAIAEVLRVGSPNPCSGLHWHHIGGEVSTRLEEEPEHACVINSTEILARTVASCICSLCLYNGQEESLVGMLISLV